MQQGEWTVEEQRQEQVATVRRAGLVEEVDDETARKGSAQWWWSAKSASLQVEFGCAENQIGSNAPPHRLLQAVFDRP